MPEPTHHNEQATAGLLDHIGELLGAKGEVERDQHRPYAPYREGDADEYRMVRHNQADPLASTNAKLDKSAREVFYLRQHVVVSPPQIVSQHVGTLAILIHSTSERLV